MSQQERAGDRGEAPVPAPEDDELPGGWPGAGEGFPPPPPCPPPGARLRSFRENPRVLTVTAVAVAAATVGAAAAVLVATNFAAGTTSPPGSSAAAPDPGGAGGQFPGGGTGAIGSGTGGGGTLLTGGTVTAVSATSITISGGRQRHIITAAITGSTRFSGVSCAAGIKAGDRVTATISGYGTRRLTASSIRDPAQMP